MSPHTAHNCDGFCWTIFCVIPLVDGASTFAFATLGLLLLMHEGELEAELDALCSTEYLL